MIGTDANIKNTMSQVRALQEKLEYLQNVIGSNQQHSVRLNNNLSVAMDAKDVYRQHAFRRMLYANRESEAKLSAELDIVYESIISAVIVYSTTTTTNSSSDDETHHHSEEEEEVTASSSSSSTNTNTMNHPIILYNSASAGAPPPLLDRRVFPDEESNDDEQHQQDQLFESDGTTIDRPLLPPSSQRCGTRVFLTDSCTVCHEQLLSGQETTVTVCGHVFHSNCLSQATAYGAMCPICRHCTNVCEQKGGDNSIEEREANLAHEKRRLQLSKRRFAFDRRMAMIDTVRRHQNQSVTETRGGGGVLMMNAVCCDICKELKRARDGRLHSPHCPAITVKTRCWIIHGNDDKKKAPPSTYPAVVVCWCIRPCCLDKIGMRR